jgi:hypothetical protein
MPRPPAFFDPLPPAPQRPSKKRFDARLNVLLSKHEKAMLEQLAKIDDMSPSELLRYMIRQRYRQTCGKSSKPPQHTKG